MITTTGKLLFTKLKLEEYCMIQFDGKMYKRQNFSNLVLSLPCDFLYEGEISDNNECYFHDQQTKCYSKITFQKVFQETRPLMKK